MKASKNFGKLAILKILELVSLGGAKTHFSKRALKAEMIHLQAWIFFFGKM